MVDIYQKQHHVWIVEASPLVGFEVLHLSQPDLMQNASPAVILSMIFCVSCHVFMLKQFHWPCSLTWRAMAGSTSPAPPAPAPPGVPFEAFHALTSIKRSVSVLFTFAFAFSLSWAWTARTSCRDSFNLHRLNERSLELLPERTGKQLISTFLIGSRTSHGSEFTGPQSPKIGCKGGFARRNEAKKTVYNSF